MRRNSLSVKICIALAALLSALVALPLLAPAEQQDPRRAVVVSQRVSQLPAKSKRWALIIGVDKYDDTQITPLVGAVNDAKLLSDALIQYAAFPRDQVLLVASDQPLERRPTRGNILKWLSNLKGLVPEDGLLLVSFAGHGIERSGRGFLCSSDAQVSGSIDLLEDTSINVETLRQRIRQMGVKQVLIILDACRNDPSGRGLTANKLTGSFAASFSFDVANKEVEAFATLYATDVGNVAYEYKEKNHGYFTWTLVEGLRGAAANERGEVTLGGLVKYLQEQVPRRVRLELGENKTQRPFVKTEGYKPDELVISITVRVTAEKAGGAVDPAAIELEFWNSIKNSSDPEDFKEYLVKYPSGTFAGLARNKIRAFEPPKPKTEPKPAGTGASASGLGGLALRGYEFDTVTVNSSGAITNRSKGSAQYCVEEINGVGLELVAVPGGTFTMGSPSRERDRSGDEGPQHQVTVQPFYMGKYEVTQAQWRAVASLSKVSRDLNPDPSHFKGDNLPVESVSWEDAMEFCARLSRTTGRTYRLPTEAEWEYACRGGSTTPFAFGETITPELVNYDGSYPYGSASKGTYRERTTPVGFMGVANAFGLYDMHGNVWEWCMDYWHESYNGAPMDGSAWETAGDTRYRVLRGGSWVVNAHECRSALRLRQNPVNRYYLIGFRVVAAGRTR
jgi:formylglycine-generating enzyme required for sulfatase activity